MVAIIQVIGYSMLRNQQWSYAFRLSPENTPERGATEYLYESWSNAWREYLSDIAEYVKKYSTGLVLKIDIQSYFDRILQDRLNTLLREELQVSKRIDWLLKILVTKEIEGHDAGRGIVQGNIGSGFLANIYLVSLDNLFQNNDKGHRRLFRYVDDIVVAIPNLEDEQGTRESIEKIIGDLKLELNPRKTKVYRASDYLAISGSDNILDSLDKIYEMLIDPIWSLDDDLRDQFRNQSAKERLWWDQITIYRSCLIELGIFTTIQWLSRELSKSIVTKTTTEKDLRFPALPNTITFSKARDWASRFKKENKEWNNRIEDFKKDLVSLFQDSLIIISLEEDKNNQNEIDNAARHLRFVINRIGVLGFGVIHQQIKDILCDRPWIIKDQARLLENLAQQGYTEDIWAIFDSHLGEKRPMSRYMCSIAIRSVRFLPRLEKNSWQKLSDYMFSGDELLSLMATETWLFLTLTIKDPPYPEMTKNQLWSLLMETKFRVAD